MGVRLPGLLPLRSAGQGEQPAGAPPAPAGSTPTAGRALPPSGASDLPRLFVPTIGPRRPFDWSVDAPELTDWAAHSSNGFDAYVQANPNGVERKLRVIRCMGRGL